MDILFELSERIDKFIKEYAGIRPDFDPEWDDEDDKYTSPDASMMLACSNHLKQGIIPSFYCDSSWDSGGYLPYTSKDGRIEHDNIKKELEKLKK